MVGKQGCVLPCDAGASVALNQLAREQCKTRILEDIMFDLTVCEIEGWNKLEYLDELITMLTDIRRTSCNTTLRK